MARTVFKEALDRPGGWQRLVGRWVGSRLAKLPDPPVSADKVGYYVAALQNRRSESSGAPVVRALIWSDIRSRQYRADCLRWYTQAVRRYPQDERSNFYVAGLAFRGILPMVDDERNEVYGRILRPEWRDSPWWSKLEMPRADLMQYVVSALLREEDSRVFTEAQVEVLESAVQSNLLDRATLWSASAALATSYRHAQRGDAMARSVYRLVFDRMPEDIENTRWLGQLLLSDDSFDGMSVKVFEQLFEALSARGETEEACRWAVAATRSYVRQGRVPSGSSRLLRAASQSEPDRMEFAVAAARAIVSRPEERFDDNDVEFVRDVWVRWGSEIGVRDEVTFTGLVEYLSSGSLVGERASVGLEGFEALPGLIESGATVGTSPLKRSETTPAAAS